MRRVRLERVLASCLIPVVVLIVGGCGRAADTSTDGAVSRNLVVVTPHVAKRALEPINKGFTAEHREVTIEFEAAMVDEMVDSMEAEGTSGDVLVMMDGPEMEILERAGVVDSTRKRVWGSCPVVLVAPEGNPKKVHSIRDLTRADIEKVAIPNPDRDSTGFAFRQAAIGAGVWEPIQDKLIIEESPHEACAVCEKGLADTAVTYSPCVLFGHSESTLCLAAFLLYGLNQCIGEMDN